MSVTVTAIFNNVLIQVGEKTDDLTGLIARTDLLIYYNTARRKLNRYVPVIKGDTNIQGIADQLEYSYPSDFKANLQRVEYDFIPLEKGSLTTLDEYDKEWRDPDSRAPADTTPQFFVPDSGNAAEFIIYPPPGSSGTAGPPIPATKNLRIIYEKHFVNLASETGNLDTELEKYQDAIENWMLFSVFSSVPKVNVELARFHFDLWNTELGLIIEEKNKSNQQIGLTVQRKEGKMWGRRGRAWRVWERRR